MNDAIRTQFPLLNDVTYLNSAAVCLMPRVSQEAGALWREQMYRKRPDALEQWLAQMEQARGVIAHFLGAQSAEMLRQVARFEDDRIIGHGIIVYQTCQVPRSAPKRSGASVTWQV